MKIKQLMDEAKLKSWDLDDDTKVKNAVNDIVDRLKKAEDNIDSARKSLYDIIDDLKVVSRSSNGSIASAAKKHADKLGKVPDELGSLEGIINDAWNLVYSSTLK